MSKNIKLVAVRLCNFKLQLHQNPFSDPTGGAQTLPQTLVARERTSPPHTLTLWRLDLGGLRPCPRKMPGYAYVQ